jgi:hypothetical protein
MKGIELFGKDWKKVQQYVGTRTSAQSRSHAQKVLAKTTLSKESEGEANSQQSGSECKEEIPNEEEVKPEIKNPNVEVINNGVLSPSIGHQNIIGEPVLNSRKRLHSSKDAELEGIVKEHKRKCTIDVTGMHSDDDLALNNDEVSLKLLKKLTTPKQNKMAKCISMRLDHCANKLEFNSDIDSDEDSHFDNNSAFKLQDYGNFEADVLEDDKLFY